MDLVYRLLYYLEVAILQVLGYVEKFFGLFAGTQRITYGNESTYLINVLLGNDAITRAFWAMALISITLSFAFAIYMVARKTIDFSEHIKQSVGQIMSSFFRGLLTILVLNFMVVACISITNLLLDRVNYAMIASQHPDSEDLERTFTDREYAQMAVALAQIANYSINPTADLRYNANACFNEVRSDLLSMYINGIFDYDYPVDSNGHYCWQGALQLLANAADLNSDLNLTEYNEEVHKAISTIRKELSSNSGFYPVDKAKKNTADMEDTHLDVTVFLVSSMNAARNSGRRNASFDDPLRQAYLRGERDYTSYSQVQSDFDLSKINFFTAYIAGLVLLFVLFNVILNFIVRMFNIALLYITAPFFASSMAMDDGERFKTWGQSFAIQLFSGFGTVIAMRLYLIFIPVIMSSDMVFFIGNSWTTQFTNTFAKLVAVIGGGWAVMHSSSVIGGILNGSPGMAAGAQDAAMRMTSSAALVGGASKAFGAAKWGASATANLPRNLVSAPGNVANAARDYMRSFTAPYSRWRDTTVSDQKREMGNAEVAEQYKAFKTKQAEKQSSTIGSTPAGANPVTPQHSPVSGSADKGPVAHQPAAQNPQPNIQSNPQPNPQQGNSHQNAPAHNSLRQGHIDLNQNGEHPGSQYKQADPDPALQPKSAAHSSAVSNQEIRRPGGSNNTGSKQNDSQQPRPPVHSSAVSNYEIRRPGASNNKQRNANFGNYRRNRHN